MKILVISVLVAMCAVTVTAQSTRLYHADGTSAGRLVQSGNRWTSSRPSGSN